MKYLQMKSLVSTLILLIMVLISGQSLAAKKFYKWTDANGVVHYSNEEPSNQKTDEVRINTAKSKPAVLQNKIEEPVSEPESTIEERFAERRSKKKHDKARAKERQKACKKARGSLAKYQQAVRYRRQDKKTGEYIYLEDKQRAQLLKEFKNVIKKTCRR
ncbi:MAG: DUF4124 domain-containing protein [Proteobacteria bacterium]|nr:DUF4124 domain-containing protein [Pseudomonadota bacterium]